MLYFRESLQHCVVRMLLHCIFIIFWVTPSKKEAWSGSGAVVFVSGGRERVVKLFRFPKDKEHKKSGYGRAKGRTSSMADLRESALHFFFFFFTHYIVQRD